MDVVELVKVVVECWIDFGDRFIVFDSVLVGFVVGFY